MEAFFVEGSRNVGGNVCLGNALTRAGGYLLQKFKQKMLHFKIDFAASSHPKTSFLLQIHLSDLGLSQIFPFVMLAFKGTLVTAIFLSENNFC